MSEHSLAKRGRLESIGFVQRTAIAQTSRPSLTLLYKANEFRGLWDEQSLWDPKIHAARIIQGQLKCQLLPDHWKQNKWLAKHLLHSFPILARITQHMRPATLCLLGADENHFKSFPLPKGLEFMGETASRTTEHYSWL